MTGWARLSLSTPRFRSTANRSPLPLLRPQSLRTGGFWAPLCAADLEGQGLTTEQIARIVAGSTPHPGLTLTEPAVMADSVGELPAIYVKCLLDWPEPSDTVAKLLTSDRWQLVTMDTGHWPMFSQPSDLAQILLHAAR